jgi:hypothetical protein
MEIAKAKNQLAELAKGNDLDSDIAQRILEFADDEDMDDVSYQIADQMTPIYYADYIPTAIELDIFHDSDVANEVEAIGGIENKTLLEIIQIYIYVAYDMKVRELINNLEEEESEEE